MKGIGLPLSTLILEFVTLMQNLWVNQQLSGYVVISHSLIGKDVIVEENYIVCQLDSPDAPPYTIRIPTVRFLFIVVYFVLFFISLVTYL